MLKKKVSDNSTGRVLKDLMVEAFRLGIVFLVLMNAETRVPDWLWKILLVIGCLVILFSVNEVGDILARLVRDPKSKKCNDHED